MQHINIITIGKLKETYWQEAKQEYLKRLQVFAKIKIIELKEESFSEKDNIQEIKKREAEKIKKELTKISNSYIIILDEHGEQLSSVELAKNLNNLTMKQFNNLTIIIGGPLGLDKSITDSANLVLSLSKLTFTHQMVRIFLLEQIYRSFMIKENRKYHY